MKSYETYLRELKRRKLAILSIQLSIVVCFFLVWEILGKYNLINVFLFSKPSDIFNLFFNYLKTGEIFKHISISLIETILGLIIGTLIGLVIAIIIWWNDFMKWRNGNELCGIRYSWLL